MPDDGPYQGGSCWMDSILYDDVGGAFGTWPDEHQLKPWAWLPLVGSLFRRPGNGVSLRAGR